MMRRLSNIDHLMEDANEREMREAEGAGADVAGSTSGKVLVGTVDHFYSNLNVAAVKLRAALRVGDIIEIGGEEEAVRQRISSMQIDRKEVSQAKAGDDVGIKLNYKVPEGADVYRLG